MASYGAYGTDKMYSVSQVKQIVSFANQRGKRAVHINSNRKVHSLSVGVRIVPEFDAPAHVGNGWQYPGAENYTVCVNQDPWLVKI